MGRSASTTCGTAGRDASEGVHMLAEDHARLGLRQTAIGGVHEGRHSVALGSRPFVTELGLARDQ